MRGLATSFVAPESHSDTSQQMEGFFMSIAQDPDMPGYDVFEKEAWGFKVNQLYWFIINVVIIIFSMIDSL